MRAKEIYPRSNKTATQYKLWSAPVQIRQPNYVGRIEVTVTAPNLRLARELIKSQYGVTEWQVGSVREVR